VYSAKTITKESKIVPGEHGNFAACDIKRGECFEWGLAVLLPGYCNSLTDAIYTWNSQSDSKVVATLSGPSLFYNTLGDESNVRCVPYHAEKRYEMYALEDIAEGTELTIRYDSMNWRESMADVKKIVGELKDGDQK